MPISKELIELMDVNQLAKKVVINNKIKKLVSVSTNADFKTI